VRGETASRVRPRPVFGSTSRPISHLLFWREPYWTARRPSGIFAQSPAGYPPAAPDHPSALKAVLATPPHDGPQQRRRFYRLKSFCGSACLAFARRVLSRVSTLWAFATLRSFVAGCGAPPLHAGVCARRCPRILPVEASLFNRQPLLRRPLHNPRPPGYKTITVPIANFSLLDRYSTAIDCHFFRAAPSIRGRNVRPGAASSLRSLGHKKYYSPKL
jgi:hypothetical protein